MVRQARKFNSSRFILQVEATGLAHEISADLASDVVSAHNHTMARTPIAKEDRLASHLKLDLKDPERT